MKKRQQQVYTCLTCFKSDIQELIQIFQSNLCDIEIIIDGLSISDIAQLAQFGPDYQARSLVVRGYGSEMEEKEAEHQEERFLVELEMSHISALLLVCNQVSQIDPPFLAQIKALLLSRLNRVHKYMTAGTSFLCLLLPASLLSTATSQYSLSSMLSSMLSSIMNFIFSIVGAVLLGSIATSLYAFTIRLLKAETTIFLLPGAIRTTHVYGWREATSRLIIALVFFFAFEEGLTFVLDLF